MLEIVLGAIFAILGSVVSNSIAKNREEDARKQNFDLNEKAADNADSRTRNLYNDLESPLAKMNQIKSAGLSPSIYSSGQIGSSGVAAGAQGAGANISPNIFGVSPLEAAEIARTKAETENIKANTENVKSDTKLKDIEQSFKQIEFNKMNINYDAITEYVNKNGKRLSLYEYAGECTSYEQFISSLRKMGIQNNITDTEIGQKTLRGIYMSRKEFSHNIAVLSEEETSSNFQKAIINALKDNDFVNKNAESQIAYLRQNIATNELTESQKEAWNELLNELQNKWGKTGKNVAIVLSMIVNNALTQWHMPNVSFNNKTTTIQK